MDLARDALDASDEQSEMAAADTLSPGTTPDAAAEAAGEPVLGQTGRSLLTLGVIAGVIILIVLMVWLMGMLAYTSPPTPGAG